MKRFFFIFFFIPQFLYSQYQAKEFMLHNKQNASTFELRTRFVKDSIISLNINHPISGIFISGSTCFDKEEESYARVILTDKNDTEYLVYEIYPLLAENNPCQFSKIALESKLLDSKLPSSLKIEILNASIQIDSIYFADDIDFGTKFLKESNNIRTAQTQQIANRLNAHLKERQLPWIAGYTSIATKTFEEKKRMFGPTVPCLYGFDYYKGGVYLMNPIPDRTHKTSQPSTRNNTFVRDFDWRDRHGKNWITSVKNQGSYGTCWAHSTAATIESNFNIYFNQVIPDSINDLSEQELISCLDNDNQTISQRLSNGGDPMYALDYVRRKGIVRENCLPYLGLVSCESKCDNPAEQVSFTAFRNLFANNQFDEDEYIYTSDIADSLRKVVIQSPVIVNYYKGSRHSVSCVGFHQIELGDTLCSSMTTSYFFVVDSARAHFVDEISWIIKNSWGDDWGEGGFARVTFNTVLLQLYEIIPPYTSLVYSDTFRFVSDEDMDGYYTWGSGEKPLNLPGWIPDEQDADDSNPSIGPMIDDYGNCSELTSVPAVTWYIDSSTNYAESQDYTYPNIVVLQGGTLTLTGATMLMKQNATIRVKNGGHLIIDNGQITNANLIVENGGSLTINNNGLIKLSQNGKFLSEIGAAVLINYGKIE